MGKSHSLVMEELGDEAQAVDDRDQKKTTHACITAKDHVHRL